ncbi:uncharacterized protein L3040_004517 [Drepanopeziza brunnea f. sp. 'multigermtubi']|uniref:uncharacterized protein n=1 Tax=Drepanopeziza brunnea f. sp. 'multigermtubi' TaxID=698441 RepID=UPI0023A6BDDB|nr:hypothetical protein L3040_004517 [Drepanopeziza brunnea f. sp. 'multigermtubi']
MGQQNAYCILHTRCSLPIWRHASDDQLIRHQQPDAVLSSQPQPYSTRNPLSIIIEVSKATIAFHFQKLESYYLLDMESAQSPVLTSAERACQELDRLCQQPAGVDANGLKMVIDDRTFQDIADCLRDIDHIGASDRPRTYAILSMMKRRDLMYAFIAFGLGDNSLPYLDRRALPSALRKDPDASRQFLELQQHVISPACQMESSEDSRHWNIPSGDSYFRSLGRLGRGGEATVDKVQSLSSKQYYARRRIRRRRDIDKDNTIQQEFQRELKILKRLDHIHLVKIFASYTDPRYLAVLMKPVASINLKEYLQNQASDLQSNASERSILRTYYGCLTHAVAYLHDSNIRHMDIKPSNILIEKGEIYIADFGAATEFDDDESMTKGTVNARTARYQSPEVFRGANRGRSSDIWSLGVTFLEMTTVLQGHTLESMHTFFKTNGTREDYAYENIEGAIQWTEHLTKNAAYSKVDNAPMQWIKDMLSDKPGDRPEANQLFHAISLSQAGTFCGNCYEDATMKADSIVKAPRVYHPRSDDKISKRPKSNARTVKKDRTKASQYPPQSPLHQRVTNIVISNLPTLSSFKIPWSYSTSHPPEPPQYEPEPPLSSAPDVNSISDTLMPVPVTQEAFEIEPEPLFGEMPDDNDHYYYSMPGAFPEYSAHEVSDVTHKDASIRGDMTYDTQNPLEAVLSPSPSPMFAISAVCESDPFELLTTSIEQSVGSSSNTPGRCSDDTRSNTKVADMALYEGCVFNTGPQGLLTLITEPSSHHSNALRDLLFRPVPELQRCTSDENLDDSTLDMNPRGISTDAPSRDRNASTAELISVQQQFDGTVATLDLPGAPPPVPHTHGRGIPKPTRHSIPVTTKDVTASFVKNVRSYKEGEMLDPETPPEPPKTSVPSKARPATKPNSPKVNPLRKSFDSGRGPPQAPPAPTLTGHNLNSHNTQVPPVQRPRAKVEKASVYMKKVYEDTASSVSTSVMSTRTRQSFEMRGRMLPMVDRSCDHLGEQTKNGNADAVRMLLRAGCNPGTKKDPRLAPIFNVVRGASARHTKCLRALIEHGVDVNVRSKKTSKTPLLEAFEQDFWSGYVTVIYLLLGAGANPNAKDPSGDAPLLKLLGGGTQPLEHHRREALALLLSSSYKTDVGVTSLGTHNRPLHLAIRRNDPWAVGMLLDKPDSLRTIEVENSEGLTPLLLAATSWSPLITPGQLEILDYLLEKGANANAKMIMTRRTPLHIAVSHGLVNAVDVLVAYGANVSSKTSEGKTAWDVAIDRRKSHGCRKKECRDCEQIRSFLDSSAR